MEKVKRPTTVVPGHIVAVAIGALIGIVVASLGASMVDPQAEARQVAPPQIAGADHDPLPTAAPSKAGVGRSRLLLAWASGGLPEAAETTLDNHPAVRRATTVEAGIDWVERPTRELPDGAVPVEVALVHPGEYAPFVAPAERATIRALRPGQALLARSASGLRESADEGSLQLVDRTVSVQGTIDDVAAGGYEVVMAGSVPRAWTRVDRFLLIQLRAADQRGVIESELRRLLRPGQALRIRARGETPFLRYGDAVLPQLLIKKTFGEFSGRPLDDGSIVVDPEWRRRNIRTSRVPILGNVTCHRAMIPQLRAAMAEVEQLTLGYTVDRGQYGGCFVPRFISWEPNGRPSHHSWGIAIDINVADNPYATKSDQDPRLVEIMERHGFSWGGRWLVPDAMHFEWVEFP